MASVTGKRADARADPSRSLPISRQGCAGVALSKLNRRRWENFKRTAAVLGDGLFRAVLRLALPNSSQTTSHSDPVTAGLISGGRHLSGDTFGGDFETVRITATPLCRIDRGRRVAR